MSLPEPYYQDDYATIWHGDCLDLIPLLEFDVVVTDPPYGVEFAGKETKHTLLNDVGYTAFDDTEFNVRTTIIPMVELALASSIRAAVTPGLRMMFDYPKPDHVGSFFYPSGAGMSNWGFTCWQPIFYYGADPYLAAGIGSRPDSKWTVETAETVNHPCPKPVGVTRWLIQRVSVDATELVLDPFMGSGTTLRAAKDLGRKSIGIEIEERYCEIAARRLGQEVLDFGAAP